jgi:predicted GNAT family N-acyltransferase
MAPPFSVRAATWSVDQQALQSVRIPVFVVEQRVDPTEEFDEIDPTCDHVLAVDSNGLPIGTGRLDSHGKIGRMAVAAAWRQKGVGWAILNKAIELARARGLKRVYLHAQLSALGFYERAGFVGFGEHFVEAGIEHQAMARSL